MSRPDARPMAGPDPKQPTRRSGENVAWLPVALVVGAILVLIAIAAFTSAY